jgi:hypothetical protein
MPKSDSEVKLYDMISKAVSCIDTHKSSSSSGANEMTYEQSKKTTFVFFAFDLPAMPSTAYIKGTQISMIHFPRITIRPEPLTITFQCSKTLMERPWLLKK